jgi:hypothetical protein
MALELCDCVFLYGFVRNWYGAMTYHYHDDYVPKPTQARRDSSEFPLIQSLMAKHPDRLIFAHPCIVGNVPKFTPSEPESTSSEPESTSSEPESTSSEPESTSSEPESTRL